VVGKLVSIVGQEPPQCVNLDAGPFVIEAQKHDASV
jgi:hypothetical protein